MVSNDIGQTETQCDSFVWNSPEMIQSWTAEKSSFRDSARLSAIYMSSFASSILQKGNSPNARLRPWRNHFKTWPTDYTTHPQTVAQVLTIGKGISLLNCVLELISGSDRLKRIDSREAEVETTRLTPNRNSVLKNWSEPTEATNRRWGWTWAARRRAWMNLIYGLGGTI